TQWLLGRAHNDLDAALAGATPYLRLFGLTAGGALLAEEALAAKRLAGNGADAAGRTAIARFFAENLAVTAGALERSVVEAANTAEPHPKLTGTIFTAAEEIAKAGGTALPLVVDVRDEAQVKDAIAQTVANFGGIDIVVNNASAISRTPVADTDMRRFDLMHQINTRGTFMVSKYAI